MFKVASGLIAGLVFMAAASAVSAQTTTYSYVGNTNTAFTNFSTCELGPCANFTNVMRVQGQFQTLAPLTANLVNQRITADISTFSFDNGQTTIASSDPDVMLEDARVTTNGAGVITGIYFAAQRWRTAGRAIDTSSPLTDPASKIDRVFIDSAVGARGAYNLTCVSLGVHPSGQAGCLSFRTLGPGSDPGASNGTGAYVPFAAGVAAVVPTLSEWAMILLGLMLAGLALTRFRRVA